MTEVLRGQVDTPFSVKNILVTDIANQQVSYDEDLYSQDMPYPVM